MRVPLPLTLFAGLALAACGGAPSTTSTATLATATSTAAGTPTPGGTTSATTGPTTGGGGGQGTAENISCNDGEGGSEVSIVDFGFEPASIAADAGVVLFTNTGAQRHTVSFDNGKECGSLVTDDLLHVQFLAPGTYPYHCSIHPSMKGTITNG